jgi:hypothetical protein
MPDKQPSLMEPSELMKRCPGCGRPFIVRRNGKKHREACIYCDVDEKKQRQEKR